MASPSIVKMSAMAFMDMNQLRVEGERSMAPRTGQFQNTPTLLSHSHTHSATLITCSDCDFQTNSELDFLRHVSTHKVRVQNPGNRDGRTAAFPSPLKRMRMSLEDAERRFQLQLGIAHPAAVVPKLSPQVPGTEQTSSIPLDLTTKPRRNADEAPIDLRKSTPPPTPAVQRTAQVATSSGHGQSPGNQSPATAVTVSQLPATQRHVIAPVMPRAPPPLIQVRRKSPTSGGIPRVEPRSTELHDLTPGNFAMVLPIMQPQLTNGQAFPTCNGEQMKVFIASQPNPPTLIPSPNTEHLPPSQVGPEASSCPTQPTPSNKAQRRIRCQPGKPSDEMSTASHRQLIAPQDTCETTRSQQDNGDATPSQQDNGDATGASYHRLGRVPEYLRGGTWHPNQPAAVEYSAPEARAEQEPSPRSSLELARMSAISTTIKQQRKRQKAVPQKRGPKPGLKRSTRNLSPSSQIAEQPDKRHQHGIQTNGQDEGQKKRNHLYQIEVEQHQNQEKQPEQNQLRQDNDVEEQTEDLTGSQGQSQPLGDADQKQANLEAIPCHDVGSKLWWQRLQDLMNKMGDKQKQDPSFAENWFRSLFPAQYKCFTSSSTANIEIETSSEPKNEETPSDSEHTSRSTIDSDYTSMDEVEDLAGKVSVPSHQSESKEEATTPLQAESKDDVNANNETSRTVLPAEKALEMSPEERKVKDHKSVTSPEPDQVKSTASAPGDTAESKQHSNTMDKKESPKKALSAQPLNVHFFRCTPCNFFTTSKQKKLAHIRKHREKLECSICLKVCEDKKCLEDHMHEHTGQRMHKCPHESCTYQTVSSSRLQSHKRTAHSDNCYQCPHCDYKSSVQGNMNRHVRKHTDERPYKCPHCPYAARVSHHLQEHMQRHAGERPYKCDLCSFATLKKTDLDRHQRCHTGEKPFACDLCAYRAPQKRMLVRHVLKIHQKQRPHRCPHCDFGAFDKKDIVEHMRLHSGEKPWKCSQCSYTTTRKRNLLRHVRVHTGEKPYQCRECPYAAADRRNLSDHIRTHTDERPFRCTICGYGSRTKGQLSRHLKHQHEAKPYKCPHCPFTATDAEHVHKHMQSHPHQLSEVYSNLFNLLGTRGEKSGINNRGSGSSDGVPSPAGSHQSVSSPSHSSSGASDDGKCPEASCETVPPTTS
ncbi:zinc finger protein 184-like isoform X1 [Branchiostoma floridae]|uniref:Zinc finger protein 184-like isoform X1 n=2 Tax=Branchiostoma floridae TaxID=7739 RepID=A0A9J7MVU5_BRAFL|nr:zinc finger protein 184-like isoform X1 [Branchiostoma floridae]